MEAMVVIGTCASRCETYHLHRLALQVLLDSQVLVAVVSRILTKKDRAIQCVEFEKKTIDDTLSRHYNGNR